MSASTYRRTAVALAVGGLLLISPPVVSGGPIWDIGIGFGYVCVVLALCLYIFPVRADGLPHRRLLGLTQHRLVGYLTLGGAALHVAILLGLEPSVGRYLLPSAPVFMWCGVLALVLAGALVWTGLSTRHSMRSQATPGRPARLATLHIVLAAAMILAASAHILGSTQLVSGPIKTATVFVLVALPLAWFALRRRARLPTRNTLRSAAHLLVVAFMPLICSSSANRLLLEPTARPSRIEVYFPHEKHTSVNCATCHHNFVDHAGFVACIECHRSDRTDLPASSEATFHVFCRDCHTRLAHENVRHGPTRACSECHQGTRSRSF